jgi:hypothetical protein
MVQDLVMSQSHEPIKSESAVHTLTDDEDDVYFGSYAHFSIHEDMLKVYLIIPGKLNLLDICLN